MKTTVIYHSADFDGIFCREIARKFLPSDTEFIGWNFGDKPLDWPKTFRTVYILDLPVDGVFGYEFPNIPGGEIEWHKIIWIDHHKTSIDSHPESLSGYRIDGVAACRLAWQWFQGDLRKCTCEAPHPEGHYDYCPRGRLPSKEAFIDRVVVEPYAVQLAGEYDIWDKRNPEAEIFQFALRSKELTPEDWYILLTDYSINRHLVEMLDAGRLLQHYQQQNDASVVNHRSFMLEFEGLKFLALNTARCNSLTFAAKDVPETGHDALMGFYWNGSVWTVSLYHANHNKEIDLSVIAKKHGGGGHRGACGFTSESFHLLFE